MTPEETNVPVELQFIEAVNTPEYHDAPDLPHEPLPEVSPLRMEAGPLDRYNLRVFRRSRA